MAQIVDRLSIGLSIAPGVQEESLYLPSSYLGQSVEDYDTKVR